MLAPVHRRARRRRFLVYDLEWIPSSDPARAHALGMKPLQLRLIGVYDGERYRHYETMKAFLNAELTSHNRNKWFYAHAGGLFDVRYVFEYLLDHPQDDLKINACFSGSSAIIVRITKGKNSWYFLDSYWLIRQSLRDIGKWVGIDKGGGDGNLDEFYAPLPELIDYNETDCVILYKAIQIFENNLLKLGGQLEMTVASSALSLFKRAFLTRTIFPLPDVNRIARHAYIASRVEVLQRECWSADYYDINSSFPHAMTFEGPGNLIDTRRTLPDSGIHLVDATIKIPEKFIPPVPYRTDDRRVYFPIGQWRGWFSSVDMRLLEETKCRIQKVHEVYSFEDFKDLSRYAETIYELRKNAPSKAENQVLKILLNSLYGKFGESEIKSRIVVNPDASFFKIPEYTSETGIGRSYLMPGVYEVVERKDVAHCHVPMALHITAIARKSIYNYMTEASNVFYCDTDGFCVPCTDSFDESNELGGLKKEKPIFHGQFAAPKLYAYQETEGGPHTIKAKGFSKVRGGVVNGEWISKPEDNSHPLTYSDFCHLLEHKEVHVEQFSRLKQGLKGGNIHPSEGIIEKRWRNVVKPKRFFYRDGSSRPWTVEELIKK